MSTFRLDMNSIDKESIEMFENKEYVMIVIVRKLQQEYKIRFNGNGYGIVMHYL
ncbi:MAG: hypothetical protein ACLVEP_07300 [Faecalibacillus sp.]|uniref:hypothetical protein n=1 Tax=Faecalibacillus sp. TaxID=2678891 RepID=UPI0039998DB0|nr:hypothetical protein [Coprobacillus sp.]